METVLLRAGMLKRFIVIKPSASHLGYARRSEDGTINVKDPSVFSPEVKIEVERATSNPDKYVHIRFCHNNKYWARKPVIGQFGPVPLVAESNEPEEDITKSSCTLFEAVQVNNDTRVINLMHVRTGTHVLGVSSGLFVNRGIDENSNLSFVNWDELVKLPKRIALKGHNDNYLGGVVSQRTNYMRLSFPDGKMKESVHEVDLMNDGHIRIKSLHFDRFWRRGNSNWIVADATNTVASARDRDTLFWPIKTGDNTIALRNAGNDQFCTMDRDWIIASAATITDVGKLDVEELVIGRKIYNVRYMVDNARVFNQSPYVAGSAFAENKGDTEASISVEVSYEESRSETFTRSVSLTAGVTAKIEAGVPLIGNTGFEFRMESTMTKEWGETTTTTMSLKATGSVMVSPRTMATVSYVGTMGTCDVPFSYTQQDQSTTDGTFSYTEENDGVFRDVNAYDFSFLITGTRSLDEGLLPSPEFSESKPQ